MNYLISHKLLAGPYECSLVSLILYCKNEHKTQPNQNSHDQILLLFSGYLPVRYNKRTDELDVKMDAIMNSLPTVWVLGTSTILR